MTPPVSPLSTTAVDWLIGADEPWTRYRTRRDLLGQPDTDPATATDRALLLAHPLVTACVESAAGWPGYPLTRHNDARHPIHAIAMLADFGLTVSDPGIHAIASAIIDHQSEDGPFNTLGNVPTRFGGSGTDAWLWMLCDAPTLVYALAAFGLGDHPAVRRAAGYLTGLGRDNGWPCAAASSLGRFNGPGKRSDPCPLANLLMLKALLHLPGEAPDDAVQAGADALLRHWRRDFDKKPYLFGTGTKYRRLKYPFIWYDILHVADVLSLIPAIHGDPRYLAMLGEIAAQLDDDGRATPQSVWVAYKPFDFGQKREPSSWLTLLVHRIFARTGYAG